MEQPVGQPRGLEQPGKQDAPADRRLRIGLEQHRVAGGQRRRDGACRKDQRRIPRRDDPDHAHRDSARNAMPPLHVARRDHAGRLAGQRRPFESLAYRQLHLQMPLRPYRSGLADDLTGDLVCVHLQQARDLAQNVASLRPRRRGPRALRIGRDRGGG